MDDLHELSFENAGAHGLSPSDIIDDDWTPCQAFADAQRSLGDSAAIWVVPSAALPGTENLVIFDRREAIPWDHPVTDVLRDIPTSVCADRGEAPLELLDLVRFYGDSHAGYEAFLRMEVFDFEQPTFAVR